MKGSMQISNETRKALKYFCNKLENESVWTTAPMHAALRKVRDEFRADEIRAKQAESAT